MLDNSVNQCTVGLGVGPNPGARGAESIPGVGEMGYLYTSPYQLWVEDLRMYANSLSASSLLFWRTE